MTNDSEAAVCELMQSVQEKYFPELQGQLVFSVQKDPLIDGVHGCARFDTMEVTLYYSDDQILELRYRMGLIPVIAHELAHYISLVDPEHVLEERLPSEMVKIWRALVDSGDAKCSMGPRYEKS